MKPLSLRKEEGPESEISSDESGDANFNPNKLVTTEEQQALALQHIEEWVSVLPWDDVMSLSLTLSNEELCEAARTYTRKMLS